MVNDNMDCRGLACPGPVLKTKEVLDKRQVDRLTVLVDNVAASENVSRLFARCGYHVEVVEEQGTYAVTGSRRPGESVCEVLVEAAPEDEPQKILVLVGTDRLGHGDDFLGQKLMANFLGTLKEMGTELWRLVLVNAGVKLAVAGSEMLPQLQELEQRGTQLLVCGTCLNHFGILEKKLVGETTNMLDIVTAMQLADKVISLA